MLHNSGDSQAHNTDERRPDENLKTSLKITAETEHFYKKEHKLCEGEYFHFY